MSNQSFFDELKKRKVLQAAAIYVAVAWGVVEIVVTTVQQLFMPQWVSTLAVILFVTGFPIAMFLAWTFDLTSSGLERTTITSRRGKASLAGALILLVAGTAGLFFLIRPDLQMQERPTRLAGAPANSIAVMPFDNASQDPNDAYLSEGLSDNLRDQFGEMLDMRVAARSSSIVAREQGLDAKTIAEQLGVANLIEGSVRRQGNTMRVSVQLIEGATGLSLLSRTFERGPRELSLVQNDIAEQIAAVMMPDAPQPIVRLITRDADANTLMLVARHHEMEVRDRQEVDVETLGKATDLYRQATEADPESALAFSRLAGTLLYLGDIDQAQAPIFQAMSLDPDLSEVQYTMGLYYWARRRPEAIQAFARAIELNPNNADALEHYGHALWHRQDSAGDPEYFQRALAVDPLTLSRHAALGDFYSKDGHIDETLEVIERIQELFVNDRSNKRVEAYQAISLMLSQIGKVDEAIAWTIRARELEPEDEFHVDDLAYLLAEIGDYDAALGVDPDATLGVLFRMRRYEDLIDDAGFLMLDHPGDVIIRYLLGFGYNAVGNYENALRILATTGQPDVVLDNTVRTPSDVDAFFSVVNASYAIGEVETARQLAQRHYQGADVNPGISTNWWYFFNISCALAILGREDEAIDALGKLENSPQIPWEPYLRDSVCMNLLDDRPELQRILEHVESRRRELREKLPTTLARFGVSL